MKTDLTYHAPKRLGLGPTTRPAGLATRRTLARIEAALSRMEHGRYGLCTLCNGQIKVARLEADPAEAVCDQCED